MKSSLEIAFTELAYKKTSEKVFKGNLLASSHTREPTRFVNQIMSILKGMLESKETRKLSPQLTQVQILDILTPLEVRERISLNVFKKAILRGELKNDTIEALFRKNQIKYVSDIEKLSTLHYPQIEREKERSNSPSDKHA